MLIKLVFLFLFRKRHIYSFSIILFFFALWQCSIAKLKQFSAPLQFRTRAVISKFKTSMQNLFCKFSMYLKPEAQFENFFWKSYAEDFGKFIRKYVWHILFWWQCRVKGYELYYKGSPSRVFSCDFSKNFKNTFIKEQLQWLPLEIVSSLFGWSLWGL